MNKIPIGIIGATGMVGQQFVKLLQHEYHPWFEIKVLAASEKSAGQEFGGYVEKRKASDWFSPTVTHLVIKDAIADIDQIAKEVGLVFCAVNLPPEETRALENAYAKKEVVVVSANSAHRRTSDVPVIIPEVNAEHLEIIITQRARLWTKRGCIVVKPNCSLQPYVPALHALRHFVPDKAHITTYQAISGAGKTFATWPEMEHNVIPHIAGEEEKSVKEPLKIWGSIVNGQIIPATRPVISAHCWRVGVADGHMASVSVSFLDKPSRDQILWFWSKFENKPQLLGLPSAPKPLLRYTDETDRPQPKLDRNAGNGMAITLGQLQEDNIFHYNFAALAHNTIRGAAGGCVLTAELLQSEGYLD